MSLDPKEAAKLAIKDATKEIPKETPKENTKEGNKDGDKVGSKEAHKDTFTLVLVPPPADFIEIFIVPGGTPLGLRLHVTDNRITHIDPNSPLVGKAFVGDMVVAVDGEKVRTSKELMKKVKDNQKPKFPIEIKHGNWSWCTHLCTTVERILMDKEHDKLTGRAINIYQIKIKVSKTPEIPTPPVDLSVRYDARDRLTVCNVDPNSITAVHLRPGDIIREIGGRPAISKTMFRYHLLTAVQEKGEINLVVEAPANQDSYRDTVEMAADVLAIAAKHVAERKKNIPRPTAGCLVKKNASTSTKKEKRTVQIAEQERVQFDIASDCDISKLKPCKGAKQ